VTVTLSKSSEFKVRHPNAVVPEAIEMQQSVKVFNQLLFGQLLQY